MGRLQRERRLERSGQDDRCECLLHLRVAWLTLCVSRTNSSYRSLQRRQKSRQTARRFHSSTTHQQRAQKDPRSDQLYHLRPRTKIISPSHRRTCRHARTDGSDAHVVKTRCSLLRCLRDSTYATPIAVDIEFMRDHEIIWRKGVRSDRIPIMLHGNRCVLTGEF
jgi:hypothetical protein